MTETGKERYDFLVTRLMANDRPLENAEAIEAEIHMLKNQDCITNNMYMDLLNCLGEAKKGF